MTIMREAFRASIVHCIAAKKGSDPFELEHFDDGLLIVEDGVVVEAGDAAKLLPQLGDAASVTDHSGKFIVPGFIDCHVHYPQLDIIASHGEQLLDWLNRYAFPVEAKFSDEAHAHEVAGIFLDVSPGDADFSLRAVLAVNDQSALANCRKVQLGYLIAFGQIGIEVVFSIED